MCHLERSYRRSNICDTELYSQSTPPPDKAEITEVHTDRPGYS